MACSRRRIAMDHGPAGARSSRPGGPPSADFVHWQHQGHSGDGAAGGRRASRTCGIKTSRPGAELETLWGRRRTREDHFLNIPVSEEDWRAASSEGSFLSIVESLWYPGLANVSSSFIGYCLPLRWPHSPSPTALMTTTRSMVMCRHRRI
ncbi:hypothetical protein LZ30DRAFT_242828 [Colletotrichum cereale]|nr:hypothetical protein LZ30DRAFT_242828 [Colletotrichum cereale]